MRSLFLSLFTGLMATSVCAETPKTFDYSLTKLPVVDLAARLLPPDLASQIVADKVGDWAPGMVLVSFYTQAVPLTARVCQRTSYVVHWYLPEVNAPEQDKYKVTEVIRHAEIALAKGCEKPHPVVFAKMNAGTPADAARTLEWLDAQRQAAKDGTDIEANIYCHTKLSVDPCADSTNKVLANLKLEQTYLFFDAFTLVMKGDNAVWRVETSANPSGRPFIDMTYFMPAPF